MKKTFELTCKHCGKQYSVTKKNGVLSLPYDEYCCYHCYILDTERICRVCGSKFKPDEIKQYICKDDSKHEVRCVDCGKFLYITKKKSGLLEEKRCKDCSYKKRVQTNIEKYGVSNPLNKRSAVEKRMQTCKEKYGSATGFQSPTSIERRNKALATQESKDKRNATQRANHNGKLAFNSEKCEQTRLERYGSKTTFGCPEIYEKTKQTRLERYGVAYPLQNPESKEKMQQTMLKRYGVTHNWSREECRRKASETRSNREKISEVNIYFHDLLEAAGISSEYEKSIYPRFYDLVIEDQKTLIEIDPTYTHNCLDESFYHVDPEYHLMKTKLAVSNSYQCIHVFDWDNREKIVNMLKQKETLYARNLQIREVSSSEASEFEELYHLQGKCRQKVKMGLYKDGLLVQLMTFGKPRYNKKYEWELLRLCSHSDYKIVGGAERLFKHFIEQCQPSSIISYCDISKFTGEVYKRLGMTELYATKPQKVWSKGDQKVTDNLLRQRGFDQLFGANYGKGTDNEQLMLEHGWLPVYDCGQLVFGWEA